MKSKIHLLAESLNISPYGRGGALLCDKDIKTKIKILHKMKITKQSVALLCRDLKIQIESI